MLIALDSLQKFVYGWVRTKMTDHGLQFLRMTEAQEKDYQANPLYEGSRFFEKTFATPGISLELKTDAVELELKLFVTSGSSRPFFDFDILVDGIAEGCYHGDDVGKDQNPVIRYALDGKPHRIQILFPCLASALVRSLELKEATFAEPVAKNGTLLAFGDSITQGYDERHPLFCYPNYLGCSFNFRVINKAIGGDRFRPALLNEKEPFAPDMITVAYGTNDWKGSPRDVFERDSAEFFSRIVRLYPGVPVYAVLPIWRGNAHEVFAAGTFDEVTEYLRNICRKYPQVRVIEGNKLVPHLPDFYSPDILHPNTLGGCFYSMALEKTVSELFVRQV